MDLRAKLARLRSMTPPAESFLPPLAASASALPSELFQSPREERPWPVVTGHSKAERISQLRTLIDQVAARERKRAVVDRRDGAAALDCAGRVTERDAPRSSSTSQRARASSDNRTALLRDALAEPAVGARRDARAWPSQITAHGRLYVCERYLEPDHHHGRAPVHAGSRSQSGTIAALLRDLALTQLDISRALYLDTETTGLAGGTGTVAFLVGLARFDDDALCVEQLIVPELGGEAPVLARLAERLAAASCVVTFNGKSFDWPLLRNRFVLSRLPIPELPPHIDLLHVSRSLWKARLPSVRLVDLEREIMRFERSDDLPGSEIPARYFEYLRSGASERLAPVLEHNQNDVIALAALLGVVVSGLEQTTPHADALTFARLAWRARDEPRARVLAGAALEHARDTSAPRAQFEALLFSSELERQLGRMHEAASLLEGALLLGAAPDQQAIVRCSLAKLYEHEHGDLQRALVHARHTELAEGPEAHGRRLGRLHRRLLRRAPQARARRGRPVPGVEP